MDPTTLTPDEITCLRAVAKGMKGYDSYIDTYKMERYATFLRELDQNSTRMRQVMYPTSPAVTVADLPSLISSMLLPAPTDETKARIDALEAKIASLQTALDRSNPNWGKF